MMSASNLFPFSLSKIASWQLEPTADVSLPALQRGYVWKPSQVENLWDSLLRGFPIGSFILSQDEKGAGKFHLLDGQQRATAISMGFYNPWSKRASHFFKLKLRDVPILWIDLGGSNKGDPRKSVFRLVTRSHPWGYQQRDNTRPLVTDERRKAIGHYKEVAKRSHERCLDMDLTDFWPWDAEIPVPFCFLLKAIEEQGTKWTDALLELCKGHDLGNLATKLSEKRKRPYADELNRILAGDAANRIKKAIDRLREIEIPGLVMPSDIFEAESARVRRPEFEEEEAEDEIETLFIRINSAGTVLAGEELIYSIYKSIFKESIELVENAGGHFMKPSRLIALATRIVLADIEKDKRESKGSSPDSKTKPPGRLRVRDFRRYIYNREFRRKLLRFIDSLKADNIFAEANKLLVGDCPFQLPSALAVGIAGKAPEVLFLLLYRLHIGERFEPGSNCHKRLLGILAALAWFGKGDGLKDHESCLRALWEDVLFKKKGSFWTKKVIQKTFKPREDGAVVMLPLPSPDDFRLYLQNNVIDKIDNDVQMRDLKFDPRSTIARWYKKKFGKFSGLRGGNRGEEAWWAFFNGTLNQRNLVLYAQRECVRNWFPRFEQWSEDNFEDTNCPWDWDHIHPESSIKGKRKLLSVLKDWHSSIGNLRAWPLELNRSDSDDQPASKLAFDPDNPGFFRQFELASTEEIRSASFVTDAWMKLDEELNVKKTEDAKLVVKAIILRVVDLYRHWYDELEIGEIFS